jgi:hypothetical protein
VSELRGLLLSPCELLLLKLVAEVRGQFGNPEEGEHSPLEADIRKRMKTQEAEKT